MKISRQTAPPSSPFMTLHVQVVQMGAVTQRRVGSGALVGCWGGVNGFYCEQEGVINSNL